MGRRPQGRRTGDRHPVTDVVVIGGGIAGVSAAAHLAPHTSVTLVEMEQVLAYHTTGRSAAMLVLNYGSEGFRPLSQASVAFLENPPEDSTDAPLLTERGFLWIADERQMPGLEKMVAAGQASGARSQLITTSDVMDLVPVIRPDVVAGGVFEDGFDVDVAGLHQAFVRLARKEGTAIDTGAPVTAIERKGSGWRVTAGESAVDCDIVVNASGAWGDRVAEMAGIGAIGLQPMRRTAFMAPGHEDYSGWPLVADADQRFYFKPDGVQLLCSLAEEVPSEPTDPRPRIEDVALAIDRINSATSLGIRSVSSEWTGLRTFAPDRELVAGADPTAPGFFWLVGQGGTGIQTAPAYGALLASLVLGTDLPQQLVEAGVDPSVTDPARFR